MSLGPRAGSLLRLLGIVTLMALGVLARLNLDFVSVDLQEFGLLWYDYIQSHGILSALGDNFTNYSPPYTYLLALMTLTSGSIPKVAAIKLIAVAADVINASLVYRIVRIKYPLGKLPLWAAGAFWCLPTVFINSAIWGQADALYMLFLLACVYFLLREQPLAGMLAFSISFAFKAQAVLLLPWLAVLLFKKRIRVWHFVLVPIVYLLLALPTVLLGRDLMEVMTVYWSQGQSEAFLAAGAPNPYIFISYEHYGAGLWVGLLFSAIAAGSWIGLTVTRNRVLNIERLCMAALSSVALLAFVLPKMHDRYFYPADVLSLVVAFLVPGLWYLPLGFQAASLLAYSDFLLGWGITPIYFGAAVNFLVVPIALWQQYRTFDRRAPESARAAAAGIGDKED